MIVEVAKEEMGATVAMGAKEQGDARLAKVANIQANPRVAMNIWAIAREVENIQLQAVRAADACHPGRGQSAGA